MKTVELKQLDRYTQFYTLIYIFFQQFAVRFYKPIISSSGTARDVNLPLTVKMFVISFFTVDFFFPVIVSFEVLFSRDCTVTTFQ